MLYQQQARSFSQVIPSLCRLSSSSGYQRSLLKSCLSRLECALSLSSYCHNSAAYKACSTITKTAVTHRHPVTTRSLKFDHGFQAYGTTASNSTTSQGFPAYCTAFSKPTPRSLQFSHGFQAYSNTTGSTPLLSKEVHSTIKTLNTQFCSPKDGCKFSNSFRAYHSTVSKSPFSEGQSSTNARSTSSSPQFSMHDVRGCMFSYSFRAYHSTVCNCKPPVSEVRTSANTKSPSTSTRHASSSPQFSAHSDSGFKLSVRGGRDEEVVVPWLWLRDHCRCDVCYNSATFQKNVDNYSLDGVGVDSARTEGDKLSVVWKDGHKSEYSLDWLSRNFYDPDVEEERFLWDGSRMSAQTLPATPFDLHMNTEDGLRNTLRNLVKYGFAVVQGAPATEEGTDVVSRRISFIMETVYGGLNTMVSGVHSYADTAYTNLALGAHNDTTYLSMPAGVQVFHCLHHDGEGGKTLLVDGFNCAEKLRTENPAAFDVLASTVVPHEYVDGKSYHYYSMGTVLSTDLMSGALTQIRFNPYDRAPLSTVPPSDIGRFYDCYAALTDIIRSSSSEFWIKLWPGNVLLVNNWRVMHGRSAFTGKRVICGCYLPQDEWTSKARVMGVM